MNAVTPFPPSWWSGNECCPPVTSPVPCPPLQPPSCFSAIAKANACWDQSQDLTALLTQVLTDILNSPAGEQILTDAITKILATTPGIIPAQALGVVDGSKAASGHIGEVVTMRQSFNFAAYPAVTQPIVTMGILPAGDWDMTMSMSFNANDGVSEVGIGGASMSIQNIVTSNPMLGLNIFGVTAGQALEGACIIAQKASWSYSSPQVIDIQTVVNQSTDASLTSGIARVWFEARRIR